jgi:hypothetical protein
VERRWVVYAQQAPSDADTDTNLAALRNNFAPLA